MSDAVKGWIIRGLVAGFFVIGGGSVILFGYGAARLIIAYH